MGKVQNFQKTLKKMGVATTLGRYAKRSFDLLVRPFRSLWLYCLARRLDLNRPVYAVMGCPSSGSSALMGVLWHLGVYMGERMDGIHGKPPIRGGEEIELSHAVTADTNPLVTSKPSAFSPAKRRAFLRDWLILHQWKARRRQMPLALKHPRLSFWQQELRELTGDHLRVIVCRRPVEHSIRSMQQKRPDLGTNEQIASFVERMAENVEELVRAIPPERVLEVEYARTVGQTSEVVDELIAFFGLTVTPEQRARAIEYIRPELKHY